MRRRQEAAVVDEQRDESAHIDRAQMRFPLGTQEIELPVSTKATLMHDEQERLLEEDVAEIVHDLKSPLSAITLEAVLLEDKLLRGDRASGLSSISRINHNVAFLDRLVLDLLDVCSLATGHFQLYREPTELRTLLEQCIDRLVSNVDRPRVELDASQSCTMLIDALRIERVVANLLDNALRYTPATSGIVIRLTTYRGGACISVIDAGPGIAASELTHIFDRYRRAGTSRGRSGCGLGLYVCKKIVEAHGGQIGVESIRGVGSRFFFELPASPRL
jgi:signal transduction histidine kinase